MEIPDGIAGIRATLKIMRDIIKEYRKNPDVIYTARRIILDAGIPPKNYSGEVNAIFEFVRDQIRYTRDPVGMELVQTPDATLKLGVGDCDDKTVLAGSLLNATGHPVQIVAIGKIPGVLSHVYLETKIGPNWVALETTLDWPLGRAPQDFRCKMIQAV